MLQNWTKSAIKLCIKKFYVSISSNSLKVFCEWLYEKTNFNSLLDPVSLEYNFLGSVLWNHFQSVGLSDSLSLSFLKVGSLVFSGIVHDDSWPWFLATDDARFLKKKLTARILAKWAKIGQKKVFCHFYKFVLLVFHKIAHNDSLQQCLTSSRGKIHTKKIFLPQFGLKEPKLGLKLGFLLFSQVLLEITYNDSLQQCVTSTRGKNPREKILQPSLDQNWAWN